jgi:hypoxanthine phosphoribosyltransferase
MKLSKEPLFDAATIAARVKELAAELDVAFEGRSIAAVVALKGAMPFAMDLIRKMNTPVQLEMIRAKSYVDTESTGDVEITFVPDGDISGKTVLVIEDIVDTGRTARAIYGALLIQNPQRVHVVTLLDKPARREVEFDPDWVGFQIEDQFVIGYGMDYNEAYRQLPEIYTMEP